MTERDLLTSTGELRTAAIVALPPHRSWTGPAPGASGGLSDPRAVTLVAGLLGYIVGQERDTDLDEYYRWTTNKNRRSHGRKTAR